MNKTPPYWNKAKKYLSKKDKKLRSIIENEKKKLINQAGSVDDNFLIAIATYDNPKQKIIG